MSSSTQALRLGRRIRAFMRCAESFAPLSTCKRGNVGCLVTDWRMAQVHAFGYNGVIRGAPNDACMNSGPCEECGRGCCGCVHAEANAIVKLSPCAVDSGKGILVCTRAPCEDCAKLIINSGCIACVVWKDPYRNYLGIDLLTRMGLTVIRDDQRAGIEMIDVGIALMNAELA